MSKVEPARSMKRPKSLPLWPILVATIVLVLPFHLHPDHFIVDDGYFYPQIARAIAQGQGSTFNGIMPTNGYHPLWMVVCVVGALITPAPIPLIQILTVLQDGLTLLSVALLVAIARAAGKRGAVAGCAVLWFFNAALGIWRLLETNLAVALQILVLIIAVPVLPFVQRKLGRWKNSVLGIVLGLTLLSRLDLVFFATVVLGYGLLCSGGGAVQRIKAVAWQSIIISALLAPYLLWNQIRFHHLLPISGAIKSTFPHVQIWYFPLYTLPVFGAVLFSALLLLKHKLTRFDILCIVTGASSALHLAYTLSFGGIAPWYLTSGYLCVALCLINSADWVLKAIPASGWPEYSFGTLIFAILLLIASLRVFSNFTYTRFTHGTASFDKSYVEPKHAFGEKLKQVLPPGSRVFVFDAPGAVALYSGMSILPADGLVADYSYNFDVVRLGFAQYAAQHNIDYFVAPYLHTGQVYERLDIRSERTVAGQITEVIAPLTRLDAGTITLRDEDLAFRFPEVNPDLEGAYPEIGVWRLRH